MLRGSEQGVPHSESNYFSDLECQQLPSQCLHGIFNNEFLAQNFRKLDVYYQQKLTLEELDERHFINTDTRLQTPLKMSPFARNISRNLPQTPKKDADDLEPPMKRQQL